VVSEAWIDDLDRWVLLDGQNSAYWVDDADEPMGVRELQRAYAAGVQPRMVALVDTFSDADHAVWFSYFATASVTGYSWAEPGFAPIFQGISVTKTDRLLHDGDLAYPRLSTVSLGLTGTVERPAIRIHSDHPYAEGFRIDDGPGYDVALDDARWELDLTPGVHRVGIHTRTRYGYTHPSQLHYLVR
jgi:hypothetical protein